MDFVDSAGTRYQLTETVEAPAPTKKSVWPWVVGGLAVAGGLVWMASSASRKANPVAPKIKARITEARDPETSWNRLWELVEYPERKVRRALLDNPNLCPTNAEGELDTDLLETLAQDFPEEVANHPLFVLHAMIEHTQEMIIVVKEVAERTKDVGLIEHLLSKWGPSSWSVRRGVALNPRTPVDVLRTLGNPKTEDDWDVRQGVAENPSTPVDLLRTLGNPKIESDADVRQAVAENPRTPVDVLRTLGNEQTEEDADVRMAVALNPRTPEDVLRTLGNEQTESESGVREAVVENPNAPVDLLRSLGNKKTESYADVRKSAKKALAKRGLA